MKNMNTMEELESIKKKSNRMLRICYISAIIFGLIFLGFFIACVINSTIAYALILPMIMAMGVFSTAHLSGWKAEITYIQTTKAYAFECIKNIFHEYGIEPENYRMIARDQKQYDVAFHNKTVDYDTLQTKIDELLDDINSKFDIKISVRLL